MHICEVKRANKWEKEIKIDFCQMKGKLTLWGSINSNSFAASGGEINFYVAGWREIE